MGIICLHSTLLAHASDLVKLSEPVALFNIDPAVHHHLTLDLKTGDGWTSA